MRDKFLTEAMGGVWLPTLDMGMVKGPTCKEATTTTFSNWSGFGKLWEWAQQQEWWLSFSDPAYGPIQESGLPLFACVEDAIHPDRFADAVYNYLKEA